MGRWPGRDMLDTCSCMWLINLEAEKCCMNALFQLWYNNGPPAPSAEATGSAPSVNAVETWDRGETEVLTLLRCVCCVACVSRDVAVRRLGTVDAAVRPGWFWLRWALSGERCLGGGAVVEVLHHDDQFALGTVQRFLLVLRSRAAQLLRLKAIRRLACCGRAWREDLILKNANRKQTIMVTRSAIWLPGKRGSAAAAGFWLTSDGAPSGPGLVLHALLKVWCSLTALNTLYLSLLLLFLRYCFFRFFSMFKLSASAGVHSCRNTGDGVKTSRLSRSATRWGDTTYTHETSKLSDQLVLRSADLTVRRGDGFQITWEQKQTGRVMSGGVLSEVSQTADVK